MNVAELIGRLRVALDHPLPQHPSDRQLRDLVLEEVQHYYNRIRISHRRGERGQTQFKLLPEVAETPIPVQDLGTWVYAYVCVPDKPWYEPPVHLVDAANFSIGSVPFDVATAIEPCEVYGALMTRERGVYFWRRTPVPYELTVMLDYEVGPVTLTASRSIPLPEHHNYLLARCVMKALPKTQWETPDKERYGVDMNYSQWFDGNVNKRRKELAAPYMASFVELQETFEADIRKVEEPRVVMLSSGIYDEGESWSYGLIGQ